MTAVQITHNNTPVVLAVDALPKLDRVNGLIIYNRSVEIDPDLSTDLQLSHNIYFLRDILLKTLPKEKEEETMNKLVAFAQTVAAVALTAGALFAALSGSTALCITTGICAALVNTINYLLSADNYSHIEAGLVDGTPTGPWYCPNPDTQHGKIVAATMIWPLLAGLFLPVIEIYTRIDRWEAAFNTHLERLNRSIQPLCEFYKTHAPEILLRIDHALAFTLHTEKPVLIQAVKRMNQELHDEFSMQLDFLRRFDPAVPTLESLLKPN